MTRWEICVKCAGTGVIYIKNVDRPQMIRCPNCGGRKNVVSKR